MEITKAVKPFIKGVDPILLAIWCIFKIADWIMQQFSFQCDKSLVAVNVSYCGWLRDGVRIIWYCCCLHHVYHVSVVSFFCLTLSAERFHLILQDLCSELSQH